MAQEKKFPFKIVKSPVHGAVTAVELPPHVLSTERELVGLNATAADIVRGLLASPVQLDALMASLGPGEALAAHLDFTNAKTSGLSIEIIARGATQSGVTLRSAILGGLLDAALASGLPTVDVRPRKPRKPGVGLTHQRILAPAGLTLPLGTGPVRTRPSDAKCAARTTQDWSETQRDVIVFSPIANGPHLAGFGAVIDAIQTPLSIEVRMSGTPFAATLLGQIDDMRVRVNDRLVSDAGKYVRDDRFMDADRRLENLIIAGSGIQFDVRVHSKRALDDCELSALSAAMFGAPHCEAQRGHLSSLRSLYPRDDAVQSFFGIVAAAIVPAIERRHVRELGKLKGNIIGKTRSGQLIRMAVDQPRSHTYVIGRPGAGKSTLILNLILQDIEQGRTVILIDPHGDLWADVRDRIPTHRANDVQLVHMGDPLLQPQLNLLELGPGDPADARARVVDTLYQLVRRLMFSGLTVDATGPMFNKYFRAALMLLLEGEGPIAQIQNLEKVFSDRRYRSKLLEQPTVSADTKMQWQQILDVDGNDHSIQNVTPWITSKLTQITQNAILRPILGAMTTSLDFDRVLAEKKVCLINLANGRIGTEAAGLLGGVLTHRLEQSAKRQECVALEKRHLASIYFDEFHTFASEFLRPLMAETRKFGLRVTLANQTLSQMINNDIDGGVFREVLGTCGNTIAFAIDSEDARYLAPRFGGRIDPCAVVSQPNYQAICQFQTATTSVGPFVVRTLPAPPKNKGM
jgi:hypothetical protein